MRTKDRTAVVRERKRHWQHNREYVGEQGEKSERVASRSISEGLLIGLRFVQIR